MRASCTILLIAALVTVCHIAFAQRVPDGLGHIPGRYRSPIVSTHFQTFCQHTRCGFEEVCEKQFVQCITAPCLPLPVCKQTPGAIYKPGSCDRSRSQVRARGIDRFECNTDYGCPDDFLCCHGRRSSRCRAPRGLPLPPTISPPYPPRYPPRNPQRRY